MDTNDPIVRDKKRVPGSAWCPTFPVFLFSILILLPLWLCVLVPITLVCQLLLLPFKCCRKTKVRRGKDLPTPDLVPVPEFATRKYDLVLFGATGFTGRLAARYLASRYGNQIRWAIAGRRLEALQAVKDKLLDGSTERANFDPAKVDLIVADSTNKQSLVSVVSDTRVVISTVGPFARYGTPLVEMCALYGTSYCDITGESDWVREMVDRYDDLAHKTGAYIVSMCGNDCVPWDLSTLMLAKHFTQYDKDGDREVLNEVRFFDEQLGGLSGGTFETIFESLDNRTRYISRLGFDPLLKASHAAVPSSDDSKSNLKSAYKTNVNNQSTVSYSSPARKWIGPSLMASVMANCVRFSNARLCYSPKLLYVEASAHAGFMSAINDMVRLTVFGTSLFCPPLKWLLRSFVLPKPGSGPTLQFMNEAYLKLTGIGTGSRGHKAKSVIYFPVDAGYLDTARMLVESGLCLALAGEREKVISSSPHAASGGVLSPATCLGEVLLRRLVDSGTYWNITTIQ